MSAGGRRFSVQVPDWGQDHLSAEAVAAYVDGELAERPYDRATRHLAACPECAAQVVAQGQARAALRSARCPSLPSSLMSTLRSIPQRHRAARRAQRPRDEPGRRSWSSRRCGPQPASSRRPQPPAGWPPAPPEAAPVVRHRGGRGDLRAGAGRARHRRRHHRGRHARARRAPSVPPSIDAAPASCPAPLPLRRPTPLLPPTSPRASSARLTAQRRARTPPGGASALPHMTDAHGGARVTPGPDARRGPDRRAAAARRRARLDPRPGRSARRGPVRGRVRPARTGVNGRVRGAAERRPPSHAADGVVRPAPQPQAALATAFGRPDDGRRRPSSARPGPRVRTPDGADAAVLGTGRGRRPLAQPRQPGRPRPARRQPSRRRPSTAPGPRRPPEPARGAVRRSRAPPGARCARPSSPLLVGAVGGVVGQADRRGRLPAHLTRSHDHPGGGGQGAPGGLGGRHRRAAPCPPSCRSR